MMTEYERIPPITIVKEESELVTSHEPTPEGIAHSRHNSNGTASIDTAPLSGDLTPPLEPSLHQLETSEADQPTQATGEPESALEKPVELKTELKATEAVPNDAPAIAPPALAKEQTSPVKAHSNEFETSGHPPGGEPSGAPGTPVAPPETEPQATETTVSGRFEVAQEVTYEGSTVPDLIRDENGKLRYVTPRSNLFPDQFLPDLEPKFGELAYIQVDRLCALAVDAQGSVKESYGLTKKLTPGPNGRRTHKVPVNSHDPDDLGALIEFVAQSALTCFKLEDFKPVGFDPRAYEARGLKSFEELAYRYSADPRIRAVLLRLLAKMYVSLSIPRFDPTASWTL